MRMKMFGRLSHVSSQPVMIPISRSLLSVDERSTKTQHLRLMERKEERETTHTRTTPRHTLTLPLLRVLCLFAKSDAMLVQEREVSAKSPRNGNQTNFFQLGSQRIPSRICRNN